MEHLDFTELQIQPTRTSNVLCEWCAFNFGEGQAFAATILPTLARYLAAPAMCSRTCAPSLLARDNGFANGKLSHVPRFHVWLGHSHFFVREL